MHLFNVVIDAVIHPVINAAMKHTRGVSRRVERPGNGAARRKAWCGGQLFIVALIASASAHAVEPAFRYSAPIQIAASAPFVQLPLAVSVYGHVAQPDLRDLRVVDSRGERIPFALLGHRSELQATEQERELALYALPERPRADGSWAAPVDIVIDGDRVHVRKGAAGKTDGSGFNAGKRPGGWLFDLGQSRAGEAVPQAIELRWSGPAQFSAAYHLERSSDLRSWAAAGSGQVMALPPLGAALGPLKQSRIPLPSTTGRFIRLVWNDPAAAPQVTGGRAVLSEERQLAPDESTRLLLEPVAAPADQATATDPAPGALYFDLGGVLPLRQIALNFSAGTRVAPVHLQGRLQDDAPWRDFAQGVFYRLERDGGLSVSPPLAVHHTARFIRAVSDERAAKLDGSTTRLAARADLASLVFASQGSAPYRLLAGAAGAVAGGLEPDRLIPDLDAERRRFGRASLGPWTEVEAVALQAAADQRTARWRPRLLWAVLLVGVGGLGVMVWRLSRGSAGAPDAANANASSQASALGTQTTA